MARIEKTVYLAEDLSQVLYHLNSVNSLQLIAGGTQVPSISDHSISIRKTHELLVCEKHERYIDFGAAVTLTQLLNLGKENLPGVLYKAATTIANPTIRNMATIGGNISAKGHKHTLWAPLIALDARLEVKTKTNTLIFPINNFPGISQGALITKIRIPLEEWEIEIFKRLGPSNYITEDSASFVFLANTQKDILSNVRIAFAGPVTFSSHELENKLIGTRLPLSSKQISAGVKEAEKIFSSTIKNDVKPIIRDEFLNLLDMSLRQLM